MNEITSSKIQIMYRTGNGFPTILETPNGGDLVSTGVVRILCMSDWAIPLRGPTRINANNTDYRPAYAVA